MISDIIEISASMIEVFLILIFLNKIFNIRFFKNHTKEQFSVAFFVIGTYMTVMQFLQTRVFESYIVLFDIIGLLLFFIYTVIMFESKLLFKILVPLLSVSYIMLVNNAMVLVFTKTFGFSIQELMISSSIPRVIVLFAGKILFLISAEIFLKFTNKKRLFLNIADALPICGICFLSLILMFAFMDNLLGNVKASDSMYVLLFITTVLINLLIIIALKLTSDKNKKAYQYQMEKMKNDNVLNLYGSTKVLYNDLQMLRHDMKNQLLVLYDYIEKNDKEKAYKFIDSIIECKLKHFVSYVNTGVDIVDTVINIKLNMAREHDIQVECSICSDFDSNSNEKIVSLVSNALDNAIEASEKVKNPKIKLEIIDKGKYTDISVGNIIESSVLNNNEALVTSKKDRESHGFGILSMKKICQDSNGMLEFYERENMFIVHILFPKNT